MKKYYIITSIVLFIGMVMTGVGFVNGGLKNIELRDGHVAVADYGDEDVTKTVKPFKKLVIDTQDDNVKILYGDKYSVKTTGFENKEATINSSNDTLEVTHHNRDGEIGVTLIPSDEDGIEITIPRNTKLDDVKIDSQSGMLDINDDLVSVLKVRASDTSVNLNNVKLKSTSFIDVNDGDINAHNSKFTDTSITNADGDMNFQQVDFHGHNNLSTTDGDINITQLADVGIIFNGGEDSEITYQGRESHGTFKQNETNSNLINISAQDGDVEIH